MATDLAFGGPRMFWGLILRRKKSNSWCSGDQLLQLFPENLLGLVMNTASVARISCLCFGIDLYLPNENLHRMPLLLVVVSEYCHRSACESCQIRICSIPGAWISMPRRLAPASMTIAGAIARMYTVLCTEYLFRVNIPAQASGLTGA